MHSTCGAVSEAARSACIYSFPRNRGGRLGWGRQRTSDALDRCIDPIPPFPCSQGKECQCDDRASLTIESNFNKHLVFQVLEQWAGLCQSRLRPILLFAQRSRSARPRTCPRHVLSRTRSDFSSSSHHQIKKRAQGPFVLFGFDDGIRSRPARIVRRRSGSNGSE